MATTTPPAPSPASAIPQNQPPPQKAPESAELYEVVRAQDRFFFGLEPDSKEALYVDKNEHPEAFQSLEELGVIVHKGVGDKLKRDTLGTAGSAEDVGHGMRSVPGQVVLKKELTWADLVHARRARSVFRGRHWNADVMSTVLFVPPEGVRTKPATAGLLANHVKLTETEVHILLDADSRKEIRYPRDHEIGIALLKSLAALEQCGVNFENRTVAKGAKISSLREMLESPDVEEEAGVDHESAGSHDREEDHDDDASSDSSNQEESSQIHRKPTVPRPPAEGQVIHLLESPWVRLGDGMRFPVSDLNFNALRCASADFKQGTLTFVKGRPKSDATPAAIDQVVVEFSGEGGATEKMHLDIRWCIEDMLSRTQMRFRAPQPGSIDRDDPSVTRLVAATDAALPENTQDVVPTVSLAPSPDDTEIPPPKSTSTAVPRNTKPEHATSVLPGVPPTNLAPSVVPSGEEPPAIAARVIFPQVAATVPAEITPSAHIAPAPVPPAAATPPPIAHAFELQPEEVSSHTVGPETENVPSQIATETTANAVFDEPKSTVVKGGKVSRAFTQLVSGFRKVTPPEKPVPGPTI